MEKNYLLFNGRDMAMDECSVEFLFGCGDVVCTCFDHQTVKYAFYNTGHLCQVSYEEGGDVMKVEVMDGCDSRKEDILYWLKQYLTTGMAEGNISVDFSDFNGYFFARFYENE